MPQSSCKARDGGAAVTTVLLFSLASSNVGVVSLSCWRCCCWRCWWWCCWCCFWWTWWRIVGNCRGTSVHTVLYMDWTIAVRAASRSPPYRASAAWARMRSPALDVSKTLNRPKQSTNKPTNQRTKDQTTTTAVDEQEASRSTPRSQNTNSEHRILQWRERRVTGSVDGHQPCHSLRAQHNRVNE